MVVVIDARGYAGYRCGQIRTGVRCKTGQISIRLGDPQIDATMERMLGSEETLRRLIDASYEEAERRAELDPRSIDRKITDLENRRERCMDAYESGEYELPQLSKRLAAIKGEVATLREFQEHAEEPIEMDSEVISKVADVFGSWASLSRSEKRELLRAYRIRIHVTRLERRKIHVSQVDIGLLGYVGLYKKMKRYGIT